MSDTKQLIRDWIAHYKSNSLREWENSDKKEQREFKQWYAKSTEHFNTNLLPQIREKGENLIGVYPAMFLWDGGKRYSGGSRHKWGTFGTGYLALTDRTLYLVSLRYLTDKYPLFKISSGLIHDLLMAAGGSKDERSALGEDVVEVIPLHKVADAKMAPGYVDRTLHIYTKRNVVEVFPHFGSDEDLILTGIEMFSREPADSSNDGGADSETVKLLKQLEELRQNGVLSDEEFAAKKKELLSRL